MKKDAKIYVAGHHGLVGSAILNNLKRKGYTHFILKTHAELDLLNEHAVAEFFAKEKPEYVFLAAAKVGGIIANNTYRAQFIYENLMIQNHVIHHAYLNGVQKLLFLGSTCIYPREAPQPMPEDCLLTNVLEYTNEPYAIAKIAGIKLCESYNLQYGTNFMSVMPTNLYGPNDNFNLETSHVLPAMLRKIYLAKCLMAEDWEAIVADFNKYPIEGVDGKASQSMMEEKMHKYGITRHQVALWGTGRPMREFLWSEDMADACVYIMENLNFQDLIKDKGTEIRNTHINIGTGKEISIKDLATLIKHVTDYKGELYFNTNKPDGTMRKLTDVSKLHQFGWKHTIELEDGVKMMFEQYKS